MNYLPLPFAFCLLPFAHCPLPSFAPLLASTILVVEPRAGAVPLRRSRIREVVRREENQV